MSFFQHPLAVVESSSVGDNTRIWAFAHVLPGARIGCECNICDHTFIENDVVIGDRVTVKCGVQLWDGIAVEDDVFIGPNATFTNDSFPRSKQHQETLPRTRIRKSASIGANATILPGLTIGERSMVGAGAVVTRDVPPDAIVAGNPARICGYAGVSGAHSAAIETPPPEPGSAPTRVTGATVHRLPSVYDLRGGLSFGEANLHVPFQIKRYFLVFGVSSQQIRGEHAHRTLHQFMICAHGSCHVVADDGNTRQEFVLDQPTVGLHLEPMTWAVQYKYSSDAVLLVLASDSYNAGDYIRDYAEFLSSQEQRMIPLNDFQRQWDETRADVLETVETVGSSGWYILGGEVAAFEKALAEQWKLAHAVGVASGLDAIEISLKALGCKRGDAVLTTPMSAFATTLAIAKLGAIPIFTDCDDSGLIDLEKCRDVFRARPEIRYFVPVHLYGHSLDLSALRALRDEFDLRIVEDCAQSILATYQDSAAGSIGQMAATSFYPTKNLGAMGDGGAILTNDQNLAARARCLRDYGQAGKYHHSEIGYNSRLDELQAALLRRVQLPRLSRWTERRRAVANRYIAGIRRPGIRPMVPPHDSHSCWHLFPVSVDAEGKRNFLAWLKSRDIASGEHYPTAIPDQEAMRGAVHEVIGDCARARRIARSQVSLPIHPYLREEEIDRVIDVCNHWGG